MINTSGQQTMAYRSNWACLENTFIGTQSQFTYILLAMAVFVLQWKSWVVATDNVWSGKPYLLCSPF